MDIIMQGEDVDALRLGLEKLPFVKCLTITSEAWRPSLLFSMYETPFFRSLPPGFKMPELWPWFGVGFDNDSDLSEEHLLADPWVDEKYSEWHGYNVVFSELVRHPSSHHVCELVIDVNREMTGISYQLFEDDGSLGYHNTLRLFEAVPLRCLDLALNITGAVDHHFACFSEGLLQTALSKLTEHFHLHTNLTTITPEIPDYDEEHWNSMNGIFPKALATTWPKLKYFGLANFFTYPDNVYGILSALPSLQTIDLDTLIFPQDSGEFRALLHKIKERVG